MLSTGSLPGKMAAYPKFLMCATDLQALVKASVLVAAGTELRRRKRSVFLLSGILTGRRWRKANAPAFQVLPAQLCSTAGQRCGTVWRLILYHSHRQNCSRKITLRVRCVPAQGSRMVATKLLVLYV